MRWRWMGRRLPPRMRGSTRARFRFQRQRAASMGWSRTAWVSTSPAEVLDSIDWTPGQRKAVLGAEGEHHGVVVGRRLQFEVERHAEALAQGQAEGTVDAAAVGRVEDQLGPLAVVEASLDHDAPAGGQVAQCGQSGRAVGHHLLRHLHGHAGRVRPPAGAPRRRRRRRRSGSSSVRRSLTASESSAVRAGASPSQNGTVGGRSPASCTRTVPTSTLATLQEWVPSKKMSPAMASTAKSSCTEPDRHAVGIEHDAVVTGLGDGATAGQRGQPRAAPGPQAAVDGVVVQVGTAAPPPRLDAPTDQ